MHHHKPPEKLLITPGEIAISKSCPKLGKGNRVVTATAKFYSCILKKHQNV